jgi:hypothetical protein
MAFSVYGYHGTSRKNAESILRNGFRSSNSGGDWLGPGAYFWQDAPQRAFKWARKHHPENPVVIRSSIIFEEGKDMDLLDTFWFPILVKQHKAFLIKFLESDIPTQDKDITKSNLHKLDHEFLNYISCAINEEKPGRVAVIRAAFTEGKPIFDSSAIYDLSHVQIAVKDNKYIKDSLIIEKV